MANLENKSKRHQNVQAHSKYTVEGEKVTRPQFCPKCPGSFLAQHKDRKTCGRCGYCEMVSEKKEEPKEKE